MREIEECAAVVAGENGVKSIDAVKGQKEAINRNNLRPEKYRAYATGVMWLSR